MSPPGPPVNERAASGLGQSSSGINPSGFAETDDSSKVPAPQELFLATNGDSPLENRNSVPWFPFYPKDFASDSKIELMTPAEIGAYVLLLCKAWFEDPPGTLPDDDRKLRTWSRTGVRWLRMKNQVMSTMVLKNDGRWHQKRMEEEAAKQVFKHNLRVLAGQKGGSAKASNARVLPEQYSTTQTHNQTQNQTQTQTEEKNPPFKVPGEPRPDKPAKKEKDVHATRPENKDDCVLFVTSREKGLGLTENDGKALWDHWCGNGFRNAGKPMASWRHTASNWARRRIFFPSLQETKR